MASTVCSMFTTSPLLRPLDSDIPNPMTSRSPFSFCSVMIQHIFVVPMSRPTMILSLAAILPPVSEYYLILAGYVHYRTCQGLISEMALRAISTLEGAISPRMTKVIPEASRMSMTPPASMTRSFTFSFLASTTARTSGPI